MKIKDQDYCRKGGIKMVKKKGKKFDYPIATIRVRKFGRWVKGGHIETQKDVKYLVNISKGSTEVGTSFKKKSDVWKFIKEEVYL